MGSTCRNPWDQIEYDLPEQKITPLAQPNNQHDMLYGPCSCGAWHGKDDPGGVRKEPNEDTR